MIAKDDQFEDLYYGDDWAVIDQGYDIPERLGYRRNNLSSVQFSPGQRYSGERRGDFRDFEDFKLMTPRGYGNYGSIAPRNFRPNIGPYGQSTFYPHHDDGYTPRDFGTY